ncbi:hypothetical protein Tco_1110204 [Tanacetum coccineum]|uniref:Uncharacterized protein n=1 Tax=Tanacetum coccineum TaxID=301880 RepID=A0ABQ5IIJ7_9ASTR
MAKLSAYNSDVLSELPTSDTYQTYNVIDQSVQETQYSEQLLFINDSDIDITSDSNMISYEQYLREIEYLVVQDTPSPVQQDTMIMSVIEEMSVTPSNLSMQRNIEYPRAVSDFFCCQPDVQPISVDLFVHESDSELNGIRHSFCLVASTLQWIVRASTDYFSIIGSISSG